MTDSPSPPSIPISTDPIGNTFDADTLAPRELRVVLVCDVVESVRWMEQDEDDAVSRWQAFTQHVRNSIVPAHGASVVKSTGDGMMIEFASARSAVQASAAMHSAAALANAGLPHERHMLLRTGIHETHARRDAFDLYGHGVNLAARITTLAGPGETIVSAPVRDHLTDTLDGDIEDMGECYLKHIAEPQRVYRVGTASAEPILVPVREYAEPLQPTIAVIPFESRSHAPEDFAIGELIADGVIGQLSRTAQLRVVSRLSSSIFRGRGSSIETISSALDVNYIVNGSYIVQGNKLVVTAELCNSNSNHVLWAERSVCDTSDLFEMDSELTSLLANGVHQTLLQLEAQKALHQPLPSLPSYSLLIGGISMMHRQSPSSFKKAKQLFEHLQQRHPKIGLSRAWLGKWYALAAAQGWIGSDAFTSGQALSEIEEGIRVEDSLALSWAVKGLIHGYVQRDFAAATNAYARSLEINPNEALTWLYKATLSAWSGDGISAKYAADQALLLSPLDPSLYYYESLAGTAYISAGDYEGAIALATASLRKNIAHLSTHKTLIVAYFLNGQVELAKASADQLKIRDPNFTINSFIKNSPIVMSPDSSLYIEAMRCAGISQT